MTAILEVERLTRRFGGLAAISDVSFAVDDGQTLGVIGPNGAGKTTMFNCISGFDTPTSGDVRLRGRSIVGERPYRVVRAGLARTFQIVRPFADMPVLANVMVPLIGRGGDPRARAMQILHSVGLAPRAAARARTLGEGDLKRLEMARALATGPSVLLLDEPFAGLSSAEIETLSDAIREVRARGTTLVIVEHRLRELLRLVDRVVVMDHGVMLADGDPEQVMRDPRVVTAYLGGGHAGA